jgi:hypothetical protein
MSKLMIVLAALAVVCGTPNAARADPAADARAVVEKGIKALGGEEALGKIKAASWNSKSTISINGMDNEGSIVNVIQGLDYSRQEFTGEFNGNKFKGITVVAGDKGRRKFGDTATDLDKDALANQKRTVYLAVIPITLLPLREKEFKLETVPDEKFDDKPAVGIKVTGPDKKDFKLYFDKESGLPVRQIARVLGPREGTEFLQEVTFSDYKDIAGIKKAMRIVAKRNGEKFITQQLTEFKVLDKVDPKVFTDVE